jgi:hypothetical protein
MAYLGTKDTRDPEHSGISFVLNHAHELNLIENLSRPLADGRARIRLTFLGWRRYHELLRMTVDSRIAFMAMAFNEDAVERAFQECFRPATEATGFRLQKLSDNPRSGLIDVRMQVEIRTSRFLVCDLTKQNRGAYWEAGFATGLGRPVFYTCERSEFDRTHFDTNHHQTILWSLENLSAPLEELKAAIRNTLPHEAKMTDS